MSALCSAIGMFEVGLIKAAPAPASVVELPGKLAETGSAPPLRAELEPLAELGCPEASAAPFLD